MKSSSFSSLLEQAVERYISKSWSNLQLPKTQPHLISSQWYNHSIKSDVNRESHPGRKPALCIRKAEIGVYIHSPPGQGRQRGELKVQTKCNTSMADTLRCLASYQALVSGQRSYPALPCALVRVAALSESPGRTLDRHGLATSGRP